MKSLALLFLALAACAKPAAAPAPIAQTCPAAPRYLTMTELKAYGERQVACADDAACVADLEAEYAGAVIEVNTIAEATKARHMSKGGGTALQELRALENESCACKDADCANQVQLKFEEWAKRHADTKGSQSEADEAGKIAERISECMIKAMTSGQP